MTQVFFSKHTVTITQDMIDKARAEWHEYNAYMADKVSSGEPYTYRPTIDFCPVDRAMKTAFCFQRVLIGHYQITFEFPNRALQIRLETPKKLSARLSQWDKSKTMEPFEYILHIPQVGL